MANRYFNQFVWTLEKNPVVLWARVTFGAAGAPTLDATKSKGFKSITRTSAGLYVITLGTAIVKDVYNALQMAQYSYLNATAPAAPFMYTVSNAVATTGVITVQFTASDCTTATDPGSGEEVKFQFVLKNSTAQ